MSTLAHRINSAERATAAALVDLIGAQAKGAADALPRAVVAAMLGEGRHDRAAETTIRDLYGDADSALVYRAATAPASLTSPQWAGILSSTAVADFIGGLGPVSAASQLIASSLSVTLGRNAGVLVPSMIPTAGLADFVAEGQPIPVASLTVGGPVLKPHKIGCILTATRETLRTTAAEPIIRRLLSESAGLALDAAMFSIAAAVEGERPAGLRNGVTPIAATAGGGEAAMIADLTALASAVAPVGGSQIVLIGSATLALKLALRRVDLPYPVLTTAALPAGTVMAVATNALVTAVDPVPEIDASAETVLHMDTEPTAIGTPGAPPTVAAPTRSTWQSDVTALRLLFGASWALRTSGAVAVVTGATW